MTGTETHYRELVRPKVSRRGVAQLDGGFLNCLRRDLRRDIIQLARG